MADRPTLRIGLREDHKIFIRNTGGAFAVTVEPPMDGLTLDDAFVSWKYARGYASGVRLVHRLPIIDLTCSEGMGA